MKKLIQKYRKLLNFESKFCSKDHHFLLHKNNILSVLFLWILQHTREGGEYTLFKGKPGQCP